MLFNYNKIFYKLDYNIYLNYSHNINLYIIKNLKYLFMIVRFLKVLIYLLKCYINKKHYLINNLMF